MNQRPPASILPFDSAREYWSSENCAIAELFNEPHERGCSIARARVLPGRETQLHALRGTTELYVIIEGEGEVHVDGVRARVARYDVVHVPPGRPQNIINTGASDLVFLCVCTPAFEEDCYEVVEKP